MKHIFNLCVLFVAAALFSACDPTEKDYSNNALTYSSEEIAGLVSFTQADKDGNPASDGNYITYYAKTGVTLYNYNSAGEENVLASGTQGSFNLSPARGSDPNQTIYIRVLNPDNTTVEGSVTLTVAVASDLTPEMKLAVSDSGTKTWTWNKDGNGVYGNMGYKAGDFVNDFTGKWWGASAEDLEGQTDHIPNEVPEGDEDPDAYMVWKEDGSIGTYKSDGTLIRQGTFEIKDYTGEADADGWSYGTLVTTEETILFPWVINATRGDNLNKELHPIAKATEFEILRLTVDELVLCVPPANNASWSEATFWRFASTSDAEGLLTNYSSKEWTWNNDGNGVYGNMGYQAGDFVNNFDGKWWGASAEDLEGQTDHIPNEVPEGDEDPDAYMVWSFDGKTIQTYGKGSLIRSGTYNLDNYSTKIDGWSVGTLETTAESMLFPWVINATRGDNLNTELHPVAAETTYEVLQLTKDYLVLCVPPANNASWSEATFWRFKAK